MRASLRHRPARQRRREKCCPLQAGFPRATSPPCALTMNSTMLNPRPQPPGFAGQALVHLVEAAEDSLLLPRRDADPVVLHREYHLSGFAVGAHSEIRLSPGVYLQALSSRFSSTVRSIFVRTHGGQVRARVHLQVAAGSLQSFPHDCQPTSITATGLVSAKFKLWRLRSIREKVRKFSIKRVRRRFSPAINCR